MTRTTRPDALRALFARRGTMAKIHKATGLSRAYISNWLYVPEKHLRAVSLALGVPQRDLPRKPEVEG